MPTTDAEDEEVEEQYEQLDNLRGKSKGNDYLVVNVVMGDFNAVVGEGHKSNEVGEYNLGKRNGRG